MHERQQSTPSWQPCIEDPAPFGRLDALSFALSHPAVNPRLYSGGKPARLIDCITPTRDGLHRRARWAARTGTVGQISACCWKFSPRVAISSQERRRALCGALRFANWLTVYRKALEIADICAGVSLKIVPVVALNRVLMELTFAIPLVISAADAPWKSDPMTWLLFAVSSDPPWQPTQEPAAK